MLVTILVTQKHPLKMLVTIQVSKSKYQQAKRGTRTEGRVAPRSSSILKILEPKSRSLPVEDMMMQAIESDSSEAVAVVRRMLTQNMIPVSTIMIETAQERKVADIINILSPGQFDAEQEKRNCIMIILNGKNKSIAGNYYNKQNIQ